MPKIIKSYDSIHPRPISRIPEVLELLKQKWMENPDLRFGQLLIDLGIAPDDLQFWHLEDQDIINHLKKLK